MTAVRDRIDFGAISKRLGAYWEKPTILGEDGWMFSYRRPGAERAIIVTLDLDSDPDGAEWIHASVAYKDDWRLPSYSDLKQMHRAVFDSQPAYQCFVPPGEHVNITSNVLHLWGRADGQPALPNFGRYGTI